MLLRNTKVSQTVSTLDLNGAATLLKIHPQTLLQKLRSGEIPAAKPGKCWVFIEEDLFEWLRSQYNVTRYVSLGGLTLYYLKRKNLKFWCFKFTTPDGKVIRQSSGTMDNRQAQDLY